MRKNLVFHFLIFVKAHSRSNRNIIYLTLNITSYKMEHFARIWQNGTSLFTQWFFLFFFFFLKFNFLLKSHNFHTIFAFASVCNSLLLIFPFWSPTCLLKTRCDLRSHLCQKTFFKNSNWHTLHSSLKH